MEYDSAHPGGAHRASRWIRETLASFRTLGGRSTRQRRRILEAIDAAPAGVSAEELVTEVGASAGLLARSTVYRTLDTLREIGAVDVVHPSPEHHRYLARRTSHQHHIVCEGCGRLAVLDGCAFDQMMAAVEHGTGFAVTRHTLEIFGACEACRVTAS